MLVATADVYEVPGRVWRVSMVEGLRARRGVGGREFMQLKVYFEMQSLFLDGNEGMGAPKLLICVAYWEERRSRWTPYTRRYALLGRHTVSLMT